ncbi:MULTISPECIES: TetR/AcrR family transcriptional regulator [Pseudofrankia]|uniref:TetR/AcrR family transcriptional regulator n=1 Tax=Pseudofrankia TaxID=2994363 RepID=UPI0018E37C10|nr:MULTISPECIES: TetR/AcrR family transcriptional regulator [Pseudofrankia]
MLDAAVALVHEQGISTGLEGIAFDEVVRRAEVSRTSAYRRWPKRDQFYGEALLRLASGTILPAPETSVTGPAAKVVVDYAHRLNSPQERRNLVVELLRVSIGKDYEVVSTAPEWRTFTSLLASHQRISNEDVREAVAAELVATERRAVEVRARAYALFTALLGYRLAPPLAGPDGFELMSRAAGATMTGLLTKLNLSDPDGQVPRRMRAFGSTEYAEWTPAVYIITSTVLGYIEPDPGIEWSPARVDDLLTAITGFTSQA